MEPVSIPGIGAIQRLAFGCEPLGGYAWGDVDVDEIAAALEAVLTYETPILLDTADTYGPHTSEERLGEIVGNRPAVIATKFGVRLDGKRAWYDTSPGYADRALDSSLARLGRNRIDVYQLHWPDGVTPLAKTFEALERFREEGRIRVYGVSNVAPEELIALKPDFPGLATFSLGFSMIERDAHNAIRAAQAAGLTFLSYGCLGQGLLSGKYDATSTFAANDRRVGKKYAKFHGEALARNLVAVDALKKEAAQMGIPVSALAVRFVLHDLPGAVALVGIKRPAQLNQNLAALGPLPEDVRTRLLESVS